MQSIQMVYNGTPMMISIEDSFNRLTIKSLFKEEKGWYASCQCQCGTLVPRILVRSLLSGNTKSCGCYNSALTIQRNQKHGYKTRQAGASRLYSIWSDMRRRCNNPTRRGAQNYALKHIQVCEEWDDFAAFQAWAYANGYTDDMTIERRDNAQGYNPENCSWIPKSEQSKNRTTNHYITFQGKTQTLTDWAKELNISRTTLHARLRRRWSIEQALTTPTIH